MRFWIQSSQKTFVKARSDAIKAIKKTFDENGISIPFPIRTLDFGIVGGETLAEHLTEVENKQSSRKPEKKEI